MARARSSPDPKANTQDLKIRESNIGQFMTAYRLFIDGEKQSGIQVYLNKNVDEPVSLRTISDWLRQIRKVQATISQKEREKSGKIEWHKLDEYDLPWEASRGVANFRNKYKYMPNWRALKWWWRLSQLGCWDPDKLLECARWYEEHEIKVMFGLTTESLRKVDERMWNERENYPGECKDK